MNPSGKRFLFDLPGRYRIRVQGQLSASWSSRLCDMVITVKQLASQQPVTTLTGEVRDQGALIGDDHVFLTVDAAVRHIETNHPDSMELNQ